MTQVIGCIRSVEQFGTTESNAARDCLVDEEMLLTLDIGQLDVLPFAIPLRVGAGFPFGF